MRAAQLKSGHRRTFAGSKISESSQRKSVNHPLISCLSKGADGRPWFVAPLTFVITVLDLLPDGQIVVGGAKGSDLAAQINSASGKPRTAASIKILVQ